MRLIALPLVLAATAFALLVVSPFMSNLHNENVQLRFSEKELLQEREYLYQILKPGESTPKPSSGLLIL